MFIILSLVSIIVLGCSGQKEDGAKKWPWKPLPNIPTRPPVVIPVAVTTLAPVVPACANLVGVGAGTAPCTCTGTTVCAAGLTCTATAAIPCAPLCAAGVTPPCTCGIPANAITCPTLPGDLTTCTTATPNCAPPPANCLNMAGVGAEGAPCTCTPTAICTAGLTCTATAAIPCAPLCAAGVTPPCTCGIPANAITCPTLPGDLTTCATATPNCAPPPANCPNMAGVGAEAAPCTCTPTAICPADQTCTAADAPPCAPPCTGIPAAKCTCGTGGTAVTCNPTGAALCAVPGTC